MVANMQFFDSPLEDESKKSIFDEMNDSRIPVDTESSSRKRVVSHEESKGQGNSINDSFNTAAPRFNQQNSSNDILHLIHHGTQNQRKQAIQPSSLRIQ